MIGQQAGLEKAMIREASRRTECPELRKDMVQQAWLEILERGHISDENVEVGHVVRTRIIPSMSKYFWANRCVVNCTRPRKGKVSVPVNISDDVLQKDPLDSDILVDANHLDELSRRHYCEYKIDHEARSILDQREYTVIKKRFLVEKKITRKLIANEVGVSSERVRQIESEALNKLSKKMSYGN